jgi:hypothetical protein
MWGISSTEVFKGLQHGSDSDVQARQWAKYAMGSLTHAAIPKMYINGAKIDNGAGMTQ